MRKFNESLLGTIHLDVGGFESARDTVDVVTDVLRAAGLPEVGKISGFFPLETCPDCEAPLYLAPDPEDGKLMPRHIGDGAEPPPTLH